MRARCSACSRVPTFNFMNTFFRCHLTVASPTSSTAAICLFESRRASSCRTSPSFGVSSALDVTRGSSLLTVFILQATTGMLLAMTYDPSPNGAYESIRYITDQQTLGWLIRGMHKWGASMMIILLFLHMGRVFFYGAYKYPRELTWVIGVVLLILTLAMGFTGYLLPFDQRAYWASVVAININGTAPVLGLYISKFLLAGPVFGPQTISRFYALHMLAIPGAIIALIVVHMWLVVKLGVTPWPNRPPVEGDGE